MHIRLPVSIFGVTGQQRPVHRRWIKMNGLKEVSRTEEGRRIMTRELSHDRANRVRDVADIFGTSERHVWRPIKSGQLKAERLGARCVRVFDSEIARYRESLRSHAA